MTAVPRGVAMNTRRTHAAVLAGASLLGWCGLSLAADPASFAVSTRELGFPTIDTTITFTRLAEHTYRVQYSNPPPSPDHLMLYTGFYFCAASKLAREAGFDRTALAPDPAASPQSGGIAIFLKPGEEAASALEPRYAAATLVSVELFARNCPAMGSPAAPGGSVR